MPHISNQEITLIVAMIKLSALGCWVFKVAVLFYSQIEFVITNVVYVVITC